MRRRPPCNAILHIYNRGNRKSPIIEDKNDLSLFQGLIHKNFDTRHFDLIGYCIMPNHYHILVVSNRGIPVGIPMQKIACKYTKEYNKKYGYNGHLFQGVYKYKEVKNAIYFSWLVRYIKRNPLELDETIREKRTKIYFSENLVDIYKFKTMHEEQPIEY